jgi:hypothetical protein
MKLIDQIHQTKESLRSAKPRSRRRIQLELKLQELMLRQIRRETKGITG